MIDRFQVIFISACVQYAIQAFNLGAFGYLLKPIDPIALVSRLDKCYQQLLTSDKQQIEIFQNHHLSQVASNAKRLRLKNLEYIEIINIEDIMYCNGDKGYTTFFLKDKREILVSKGLKEYEKILHPFGFLRCHQSHMINFQFVRKYFREGYLQMHDKQNISVSIRKTARNN
ncbi:LytR/AlgR family response regulator transcription factor [Pedobacter sp. NJ-S-72]